MLKGDYKRRKVDNVSFFSQTGGRQLSILERFVDNESDSPCFCIVQSFRIWRVRDNLQPKEICEGKSALIKCNWLDRTDEKKKMSHELA